MAEDIITQIEDDNKQLQRIALFKKSLPIIFIATIIIAVFWNVYEYYKHKAEEEDMAMTKIFIEANLNSKTSSALIEKMLSISKTADDKIAELAILRLIQEELVLHNKTDEAKDFLYKIANDLPISSDLHKIKYNNLTKAYAKYLYISLFMDEFGALSEEHKKIVEEFISSLTSRDGAFYDSALLSKAIYLAKTKSLEESKLLLKQIEGNKNINEFIRRYAQILLHNINLDNTL
ncbi:MAG: hypothetical protein K9G11_01555 [Rickettsiaceae bacterium]|nr:hypothetical protein [Rickettsiaceae bacterium]